MALGSSGRIRGITIEIGGETTKLEKALAGVNSTLKTTGASLKDVNKLLKLDPKNTELLQQKQKLLGDAIKTTKEKLKEEEAALAKMKENDTTGEVSKEQQALERDIVETRKSLEELEKEYSSFGSVGAQKLQAAGKAMQDFGDKITSAGKTLTTKVTAPIVGVGAAAVKTTVDFDSQMSKVAAISGATDEEFEALRKKAIQMGGDTKFSATEAAQAMEYMAMAGWKTDDMLNGISGIMNLAAASGEDLASTSDIVTDAMTAFGMSAKDSGHFADVLAAASTNSNTNVGMLGESFKYAAPIAGSFGYSVEDVATALGLMANAGIKASQGGTSLRSLLKNLSKPTDTVYAAMERLGISLQTDDGRMKSLSEIMGDLRKSFGNINMPVSEFNERVQTLDQQLEDGEITQKKYDKELEELTKQAYGAEGAEKARAAAMLAGTTGMSGLLAIVNASDDDYDKLTKAINGSGNAAQDMADKMQDNLGGQLTSIKSKTETLAISFGDIMTPALRKVATAMQGLLDRLNSMDPKTKTIVVTIAGIAAAIGPLLLVMGGLITSTGKVVTVVGKLSGLSTKLPGMLSGISTAMGAISAPVVAVVAVIAVLVAAFIHLWRTNEDFRKKVTAIWERVKKAFQSLADKIKEVIDVIGPEFKKMVDGLKKIWDAFCKVLAPVILTALENVAATLETIFGVIEGILDIFIGIFTGDWSKAWEGVKKIFTSVVGGFGTYFSGVIETIKKLAKGASDGVKKAWTDLKTGTTKTWNDIKKSVSTIAKSLQTEISTKFTSIKTSIATAWNAVKTNVSTSWNSIKSTVGSGLSALQTSINTKFSGIKTSISSAWNSIKTTAGTTWDTIKSSVVSKAESIRSSVSDKFSKIKDKAKTSWDSIKTHVSTAAESIRSTVSSKFSTLKSSIQDAFSKIKIQNPFTALVNAAYNAVKKIKDYFDTTLKFPSIKLPRLKVEGRFSLRPPSVPRFSLDWVTWYKKAYENPYLFTSPTVVGNRGFGDGKGGEIVYGRDQLMRDIAQVTAGGGITINVYGSDGMNTKQLARDVKNEFVRVQKQEARAWA